MKLRNLVPVLAIAFAAAVSAQPITHRNSTSEYFAPLAPHTKGGFWMWNLRSQNHNPPYYESGLNYLYHTNWNASDFTAAPIPLSQGSQASRVGYYGSTAFQKGNGYAAYFINTYADSSENEQQKPMINSATGIAAGFGGQVDSYGFRPWSRGVNSKLCVSSNYRMNYYYKDPGGLAQSYFSIFLKDEIKGKLFAVTVRNWVNQESVGEGVFVDPDVGLFAETFFGNGTRYVTKQPNGMDAIVGENATQSSMMQDKYFSGCITRDNLANIIADLNANTPGAVSTDPDYFSVSESFNQTEIMCLRTGCFNFQRNNEASYGDYDTTRRMHIAATWWNTLVQSLN